MPQIQAGDLSQKEMPTTTAPTADYFTQQASPQSFGSAVGEAAQKLGMSMENAGDMLMKHQVAYWQMRNETLAKEADVSASRALVDAQYNTTDGFMYKFGKDAVDGMPAVLKKVDDIRQGALKSLPNEHSRDMFDQVFLRRMQYTQESMAGHAGQENKKWQIGTSQSRIDNEMNMLTSTAYDDDKFNMHLATVKAETLSLAELQGMSPEQTKKLMDHNTGEAWQTRLNAIAVHNPDDARNLFSLHADEIDALHRPVIDQHLKTHQEAALRVESMRNYKLEATAEREMKKTQGINEGNWLEKAYTTQNIDIHDVAEDMRLGKISVEGMKAIHSAIASTDKVEDDKVKVGIWADYANGGDIRHSALAASDMGQINPKTTIEMLRAAAVKPSEIEQHQYHVLKTAVGGHAAENGFFKDPNLQKESEQLWAQAQAEFYRRTRPNRGQPGEDPEAVVHDMLPRYVKSSVAPASWPNPRAGAVHNTDEVNRRAIDTMNLYNDEKITTKEYDAEVKLLTDYKEFYEQQDKRREILKNEAAAREKK